MARHSARISAHARIQDFQGTFTVQLFDKQAPISVENFYRYLDEGFFDGTIFHRVIPNFMVQGGGLTEDLKNKKGLGPIKNGSHQWPEEQARHAVHGAHQRHQQRDDRSSSSTSSTTNSWSTRAPATTGYAVFGRIDSGMDVVDAIVAVKTGSRNGYQDVPVEAVTIESVKRIEPKQD